MSLFYFLYLWSHYSQHLLPNLNLCIYLCGKRLSLIPYETAVKILDSYVLVLTLLVRKVKTKNPVVNAFPVINLPYNVAMNVSLLLVQLVN